MMNLWNNRRVTMMNFAVSPGLMGLSTRKNSIDEHKWAKQSCYLWFNAQNMSSWLCKSRQQISPWWQKVHSALITSHRVLYPTNAETELPSPSISLHTHICQRRELNCSRPSCICLLANHLTNSSVILEILVRATFVQQSSWGLWRSD